jgi:cytoskeletal protein RodZ
MAKEAMERERPTKKKEGMQALLKDWNATPTAVKFVTIGGILGLIVVIYSFNKAQPTTPTDTSGATPSSSTFGASSGAIVPSTSPDTTGPSTSTTGSDSGSNSSSAVPVHEDVPYLGLIGRAALLPTQNGSNNYTQYSQNGVTKPIPLPSGTKFIPGNEGRVWYTLPGSTQQQLLTAGSGPGITNPTGGGPDPRYHVYRWRNR